MQLLHIVYFHLADGSNGRPLKVSWPFAEILGINFAMKMLFEKWHGCKNDFIVVWIHANEQYALDSLKRQASQLCARDGSGIGADGILVLHTKLASDLLPSFLGIINQDGSMAANCGNGLRCSAGSILKKFLDADNLRELPEIVDLTVGNRVFHAAYLTDDLTQSQLHHLPHITIDMGLPEVDEVLSWTPLARDAVTKVARENQFSIQKDDVHACEIGNQHIVVMNQNTSDRKLFHVLGSSLQKVHTWQGGINVHICEPSEVGKQDQQRASQDIGQSITEIYKAIPWERGVGPTNACGSGACAIAAVAFETGDASRSDWIAIDMPGGRLYARQADKESPISLAGPAKFVFSGELTI